VLYYVAGVSPAIQAGVLVFLYQKALTACYFLVTRHVDASHSLGWIILAAIFQNWQLVVVMSLYPMLCVEGLTANHVRSK
jgi:hypothetical protein